MSTVSELYVFNTVVTVDIFNNQIQKYDYILISDNDTEIDLVNFAPGVYVIKDGFPQRCINYMDVVL